MTVTVARAVPGESGDRVIHTSPAWLAFALTVVTGGAYLIVWAGRSWSIMKRERGDRRMQPMWHALSLVVPFYMIFRVHAHFRTLNELLASVGARKRANLAIVVGLFAGFPLTFMATGAVRTGLSGGAVLLIAALCAAIVAGYGQHHLNAYLRARTGTTVVSRVDVRQWIGLVFFGILMASFLVAGWTTGSW